MIVSHGCFMSVWILFFNFFFFKLEAVDAFHRRVGSCIRMLLRAPLFPPDFWPVRLLQIHECWNIFLSIVVSSERI